MTRLGSMCVHRDSDSGRAASQHLPTAVQRFGVYHSVPRDPDERGARAGGQGNADRRDGDAWARAPFATRVITGFASRCKPSGPTGWRGVTLAVPGTSQDHNPKLGRTDIFPDQQSAVDVGPGDIRDGHN